MELKRLGKYEIVAKIGQGAMGEVHRAHDPILNREVAVKTLAAGVDADEELRRRFRREAQSAAGLNHPNIVTVYDFGEEQGHMYIAMELLKGSDLKEVITRKLPMTLEAKLDLMDQICDGLAFAHAGGVIHRDLKPANLYLLANGRVKIMDFGLARIGTTSDLTGVGMMLGTPNYMSPEQVRGEKATTRSDVFSLGVVFYELLSGRKAFDADSLAGVLFQVMQVDPEPLERLRAELGAVALVVQRAMAKDPAHRFAHAGELREALREARRAPVLEAARSFRPTLRPLPPGDTPSTAGTMVRPAEPSRPTSGTLPALAETPSSTEATPIPARTRQPEATTPPTVAATIAETVAASAPAPTVLLTPTVPPSRPSVEAPPRIEPSLRRTRVAPTIPRPVPARQGFSPTVLGAAVVGLVAVGVAAWLVSRPDGDRSAVTTDQTAVTPPPSSLAPPTTLATALPAPTAARPTEAPAARLAEAERSLRDRDYRAALRVAEAVPAGDPGAASARRLAEEARRGLRTADAIAVRLIAALDAHDAEKASLALSELLAQDPRRPDASFLAARLNEAMARRRAEAAAKPPAPAPTVAAATASAPPSLVPPTTAPAPAASLPSAPPTTLPPLQSEAAARQAIRGVLDEYRAAFERRDADALRAVYPGVDYENYKRIFASVTGYTVRIDVKDVTVKNDEGTASCVVTYQPQPKPSQKIPPVKTVFHLRRTGDVWLVQRLEAK
jgi:serine/threonine-protein kinase